MKNEIVRCSRCGREDYESWMRVINFGSWKEYVCDNCRLKADTEAFTARQIGKRRYMEGKNNEI